MATMGGPAQFTCDLHGLRADLHGLRNELPTIVGDVMRDVLHERDKMR